jgi:hypothetical protein
MIGYGLYFVLEDVVRRHVATVTMNLSNVVVFLWRPLVPTVVTMKVTVFYHMTLRGLLVVAIIIIISCCKG